MGHKKNLIDELLECLQFGRHQTIDELLDAKKRFREIGGCIIAESILTLERKEQLFPCRDWYSLLFSALLKKLQKGSDPEIAFVTLNYDRSLEFFLSKVAQYECREEDEERVTRAFEAIPIIHAHGSLGGLKEIPFGHNGNEIPPQIIQKTGRSIQIISDKLEDAKNFQDAKQLLGKSEQIICLGFGYHPSTVEKLFSDVDPKSCGLEGTAVELSAERTQSITDWSGGKFSLRNMSAAQMLQSITF